MLCAYPDLDSGLCGPWSAGCCVHSAPAGSVYTGSPELGGETACVDLCGIHVCFTWTVAWNNYFHCIYSALWHKSI